MKAKAFQGWSWVIGYVIAVLAGTLLALSMAGARASYQASGICLQQVVVFNGGDSLGIAWSNQPCLDQIDLRVPSHWQGIMTAVIRLPRSCAIVFRLPGLPAPIIDTTFASPACGNISPPIPTQPLLNDRRVTKADQQ